MSKNTAPSLRKTGMGVRARRTIGNIFAILRIEEVHLDSCNVDFAVSLEQIVYLSGIYFVRTVVVDIEFGVIRKNALGDFETAESVISGHGSVSAVAES